MIKILHVINGLETGGAEMMLYRLLAAGDRTRFQHAVVSLRGVGPVGERIARLGLTVHPLGRGDSVARPSAVARLARIVTSFQPDVVHTWMYYSNLLGLLATRLGRRAPVCWSCHG